MTTATDAVPAKAHSSSAAHAPQALPLEAAPPELTLAGLFLKFLRFGCMAFGGPVAQIAMVRHALVDEERWISSSRFNRLLAVMQILPGPEAHELCVHLGMMARGRIGGLLAGLGFMLPGFLLMLIAGWIYQDWIAGHPSVVSAFLGVQVVVLAIITRAVHRIGSHALADRLLAALAALAFVMTVVEVPFWLPLITGGLVYAFSQRKAVLWFVLVLAIVGAVLLYGGGSALSSASVPSAATIPLLFLAGLKGGLLTFGGAYTAIPYVRADTVSRGWLSDATFLDGVALAGVLPAPLVIFATFTGYAVGGLMGAVAITLGMFLPAFAFSMIFFKRLEAVVENPALHRLFTGVAAAVVGVIAATLLQLALTVAGRLMNPAWSAAIFVLGLASVWFLKRRWVIPALVLAAGAAGWVLHP